MDTSIPGPSLAPSTLPPTLLSFQNAELFYKHLFDNHLPTLIPRPEVEYNSPNLDREDLVMFQPEDGDLKTRWMTGEVYEAITGSDGRVREVVIKYQNHSESDTQHGRPEVLVIFTHWSNLILIPNLWK